MTDSLTDEQFREESRLRDDELDSPARPASEGGGSARSSPQTDALSPAQRKRREAIARKKQKAKARKAEKKEAAERERAEADAAARLAEAEEAEAAEAEAAAAKEAADVEAAEDALKAAQAAGDAAATTAAEERLVREQAEAAAATDRARRERAEAQAARERAAKEEAEAQAAQAALEEKDAEEEAFQVEEDETARRTQESRAAAAQEREEKITLLREAERALVKLDASGQKATAAIRARENAEKQHLQQIKKDEQDALQESKDLFEARAAREEARLEATAAAEELQLQREAVLAAKTLQAQRDTAKGDRDESIQRLRRAEVDAENVLNEATTEAETKEAEEELDRVRSQREAAEKEDAKLLKEARKEIVAAKKQRLSEKAARAKQHRKQKEQRNRERAERYAAHKNASSRTTPASVTEPASKQETRLQKAALLKLSRWLRGRGYALHVHEVANKLSAGGHGRGQPPGSGWIRALEQMPAETFESYMADIHGDQDWQTKQKAAKRAAYSRLKIPVRQPKPWVPCCADPNAGREARRRADVQMQDMYDAQDKWDKARLAVETAELELRNAKLLGDGDAMQEVNDRLPRLRDKQVEAAASLEQHQQDADGLHAELETLLRPTKSHPIEPVRVTAHGRELADRAKPPAPRLVRADSAEEMYDPPREIHKDKPPWQHPTVADRQQKEQRERADFSDASSKSVEDSATDASVASKDETLDHSYEKDEKDYVDLSGFGQKRRRGVVVSVMGCRNLPKADLFGKTDPYVKVQVAGDEKQTSVIDNGGADPSWGENGHRMEFFPTVEGFPVIKVKAYDEDFGPERYADDLLGKCEIDMGRLKFQLWESSEVRGWFQLVLKGKDCGLVELKISWEPHPPLDGDLSTRQQLRAARERKRQHRVYSGGNMVDPSESCSYSIHGLDVTVDEADLREALCGKWRARGTLDDKRPTLSERASPGFSSQAWLETVGQEEEEFELYIDEGGNLVGGPLRDIDVTDENHFEMSCILHIEHETEPVESQSADGKRPSATVGQRSHLKLTQWYPVTQNTTEWSAIVSSDGKTMENGKWKGPGIAGYFSARRLCRMEPSSGERTGNYSPSFARNVAEAHSRHVEREESFGKDHPETLQAHREMAQTMREHGNFKGYEIEMSRVQDLEELRARRDNWDSYPSHILNPSHPQFSPAPSAVLPPTTDDAEDDGDETVRIYIDESLPAVGTEEFGNEPDEIHRSRPAAARLTLTPEFEPEPQPVQDAVPDHIEAILNDEGDSMVSPVGRLEAGASGLDDLLASDDEDSSLYNNTSPPSQRNL